MSSTITPYLFFGGRCEEALEFYRKALGAEVNMMMRFNESPDPAPPGMVPAGFENKVMHGDVTIAGAHLMVSDGCDEKSNFEGFRLALTYETKEAAHKAFDALAAGGNADMPLSETFWSPCYGMVTDKFKVGWMVMVPAPDCG